MLELFDALKPITVQVSVSVHFCLMKQCNATARRSSTTCNIDVRGGQGREFGLGTQLDDEKVDSVPHRST